LKIEETDASGKALASYVYDDKGSPISVIKEGNVYNYQYNEMVKKGLT
jgi:hypothetical protein